MPDAKPTIALTMGDPAGVGPELALQALADQELARSCTLVVFGDSRILESCSVATSLPAPNCSVIAADGLQNQLAETHGGHLIVDIPALDLERFKPATVSSECGRSAYSYIQSAISAALNGFVQAVTTGPINKEALNSAGIKFPGHTEMFAESAQAERWCMMQYSDAITCSFATVHVGYHEVPALLTQQRVFDTIELTVEALTRIRARDPRLLVCGLNPHAGEHGLFGSGEEESAIIPAIQKAQALGYNVDGPLPPDTAFLPQNRSETDAFVCMYHDQGHIPVKALAFDSAVNTTLGLGNLVRTSVDHGTAFDIAWQGKANPSSMFAALKLAIKLAAKRA